MGNTIRENLLGRAVCVWVAVPILAISVSSQGLATESSAKLDEEAVLATVQAFFDVLASRDVETGGRLVASEAQFFSTRGSKDGSTVRSFDREGFLASLAGGEEVLLERMWEPEVRIRGDLATVWTEYDFYRDGEFSHCGVDAFSLIRIDGRWRITTCVYTVEPEGCCPSPLGPPTN